MDLGLSEANLQMRQHEADELAHYAKRCVDIEYLFPFGWQEIEGVHDRGDWDLSRHSEFSGKDLIVTDEETKERYKQRFSFHNALNNYYESGHKMVLFD